jgi:hypothetical protein
VLEETPSAAAHGTPAPAAGLAAPQSLTARATPFVSLPRKLGYARGHPWRERLCVFAVFSLLPTVLFWVYFTVSVWPRITPAYSGLRIAAPISSLWITFGPLLMQQGEFSLERLIAALNRDGPGAGWNFGDIQHALDKAARLYWWITIPLAILAAAAILAAYPSLAAAIPLNAYSRAGGVFDLLITGFVSASGIWAIYTALSVIRAATRRALIPWHPFRSQRPEGLVQLYTFTWTVALIFSTGSVFLPALYVLRQRLGAVPSTIVLIFAVILFLGGLVLFSVPALMLYNMAQGQQARVLDTLAPVIETSAAQLQQASQQTTVSILRTHYTLSTALQLRTAIAAQNPAPVFNTIARAATTLLIPLFLTLIQIASALVH